MQHTFPVQGIADNNARVTPGNDAQAWCAAPSVPPPYETICATGQSRRPRGPVRADPLDRCVRHWPGRAHHDGHPWPPQVKTDPGNDQLLGIDRENLETAIEQVIYNGTMRDLYGNCNVRSVTGRTGKNPSKQSAKAFTKVRKRRSPRTAPSGESTQT